MAKKIFKNLRPLRILSQTICLGLFLWLLGQTKFPVLETWLPLDFFLRFDPLVALIVPLATRELIISLWPAFVIIIISVLAGRVFCGFICPLGTTLDLSRLISQKIFPSPLNPTISNNRKLRPIKYFILALCLGAAVLSLNLSFWVSPISLITRFYALLIHPLLLLTGGELLVSGQTVSRWFGFSFFSDFGLIVRQYDGVYFILIFFGLIFYLEHLSPRFWCAKLCPAGAFLGLCGQRPIWRRTVTACQKCGHCASQCPTGAIGTNFEASTCECITCQKCTNVCPEKGIEFSLNFKRQTVSNEILGGQASPKPTSRRTFLMGAASGLFMAQTTWLNSKTLLGAAPTLSLLSPNCIRPPGARPESDFLARCIRCGQCLKVCPTNGLQATWLEAGPEGMFSPILVPRRGACEPHCHDCGKICPTGAIKKLSQEEKFWAKIGTAIVLPHRCLAWAEGRQCLVCEEVCPYGAIEHLKVPNSQVHGPLLIPHKCFGCGYCEKFCPANLAAIVVEPLNPLRLNHPNYRQEAQDRGLSLIPASFDSFVGPDIHPLKPNELPPGFSD
ncbi:MAG: 4Fe-4S dicluster domain-containing protein [Candidatus Adiutrix sp.]